MNRFAIGMLSVIAALGLLGCKSKLEKCQNACTNIEAEELARCGGEKDPAACQATLKATTASCHNLCEMAMSDSPRPASSSAAAASSGPAHEVAQRACDAGKADACADLAGMYVLGRGVAKSDPLAALYFQQACDGGSAFGCEMFGKMARDGRGLPKDEKRASHLFEKACTGGSFGACTSLGLEALKSGDKKKGVELLTKACDGKDEIGCTGLAGLYLHGNGVPKNAAKAKELLTKACDLGSKSACEKARELGP